MRQRVTDIRIHYSTLDWVKSEIDRYHDAIDEVEISMLELEDLLHEQESEAIIRLLDEVESVKITMGRKKAALQDASVVIGDYVAQMSALVALTNSQEMMRVDHNHVNRRIRNMRGVVNRTLTEHHHNVLFTPTSSVPWRIDSDERERIRQLMQRNFTRLDNFRTGTLRVALQRALDLIQQIADIRTSKLIPFQDLDREFRDRAHEYYRTHIDRRTRRRNWWIQLGEVINAFVESAARTFLIVVAIALFPKAAIAVIIVLALACVVMANIPEEYVPEWAQGFKETADSVVGLARDTMRYGPQVLVDAVTDGVMDMVQTNEGVAALSGTVTGLITGKAFVKFIKPPAAPTAPTQPKPVQASAPKPVTAPPKPAPKPKPAQATGSKPVTTPPKPAPPPKPKPVAPSKPAPKPKPKPVETVPPKAPVNISLKYKKGWTPAQKLEADAKVKALSEARTVKTPVARSGTSAASKYKSAHGKGSVPKGNDIDHVIDLQLGGVDAISNLKPLNFSVNRSLGAQIRHAIKRFPNGTNFGNFTIQ